jgi:hypothetical protein
MAVNNKRNLIIIASLFVAVLSVCIIITIKENNELTSSSSGNVVSTSQLPSSAVLNSANLTSSTSAASSVNNQKVEIFLKEAQANSDKFQFFDFAISTVNFSDDTTQIQAVVSYYRDKQKPTPTILLITNQDTHEYDLAGLEKRVFADNGKITITGKNDLTVPIMDPKTKEIYDCKINYKSTDQGRGDIFRNEPVKRESK